MKTTITTALVATSLLSLAACNKQPAPGAKATDNASAQSEGINGTWKVDLATVQFDEKPDQFLLKDGKFSCATCTPPLTVAADGAFHPVSGRVYSDNISVKVDDDHNVTETAKKAGKVTSEQKYSVSADGKMLTIRFTDHTAPNGPVTGSVTESRVADAPAGAHVISGSWKTEKLTTISQGAMTVTYTLSGDSLRMSSPTGNSYDAQINGPDVPIKGDVTGMTVSVTKTGVNSYRETNKRAGKVVYVTDMTVDGNKLHIVNEDKQSGSKSKYDANRS